MIDPPELMLATPTDRRFSDDDWLFERKLNGVRALSIRDGWRPQLWSRAHKRLDDTYPDLVELLAGAGTTRFVADGEIVRDGDTVRYHLFDLLYVDGTDLTGRPLWERKEILRTAFRFGGPLHYTEHREGDGEDYYRHACDNGWEGLIAKRADSPYVGGRSADWLKFKCVRSQAFVVGGFTEPQGSRAGFGALIVGYHENGALRYAGKVGTGYDHATLRALRARMDAMAQDTSPFADPVPEPTAHWIRPELVVHVGFSEWTREGRLRHPRFGGLRTDTPPADVVREQR
ncbi:ATP-dependent DNA ligase [Actinophytocola sp. NPDC049390]|uniref:ATP-dependent DNA ligase n=1 Tax=Actinophytocola sp. NPDC049390 TaxID=3363894 RepID=UPI00378A9113